MDLHSRTLAELRPRRDSQRGLKVAGLFAGIGGFERGLALGGRHATILLCEKDAAAQAVLQRRFGDVQVSADIETLTKLPDSTDVITAGFPCQDLSQVGPTLGMNGKHSSLVSHVFKLLRKQRIPWVILENVPFMLHLQGGAALESIVASLEQLGYTWAYRVVDTQAFGLPQRRRRVFIVASLHDDPRHVLFADDAGEKASRNGSKVAFGFYWTEGNRGLGWAVDAVPPLKGGSLLGIPSPPAVLMPRGDVVLPDIRDAERLQGFPANWTRAAEGVGRARSRWRLVGNAVTVDVAKWLGARLARPATTVQLLEQAMKRGTRWPNAAWGNLDARYTVDISEYPVQRESRDLAGFFRYPAVPLSARASAGFLDRLEGSNLRVDARLIAALKKHIKDMRRNAR